MLLDAFQTIPAFGDGVFGVGKTWGELKKIIYWWVLLKTITGLCSLEVLVLSWPQLFVVSMCCRELLLKASSVCEITVMEKRCLVTKQWHVLEVCVGRRGASRASALHLLALVPRLYTRISSEVPTFPSSRSWTCSTKGLKNAAQN